MASPKVPPKSLVSFLDLKNRCPRDQVYQIEKMIEKNRQYNGRLRKLGVGLPPIDWEYYKRNVRAEAVSMVEDFQKKYTSLAVPKPVDKYAAQIEKLKEDVKKEVAEFVKKSNERIAAYQKEMEVIRSTIPYNEMTWEDYCILYPKDAPDFINRPTFWPHDDAEQIGYVEPIVIPKDQTKKELKKEKTQSQKWGPVKQDKKKDDKKMDDKK